jgi:antirestriction protein ArdC
MRQTTSRQSDRKGGQDQDERSPTGSTLYDQVTARVIAELEAGRFPWVQPWGVPDPDSAAALGLPFNAATGRSYSGINILILWGALFESGYPAQGWLTFRQALSLGGHVRKGERGTTVVYADRFVPASEQERAQARGEEVRGVAFLKRFTVFNIAQCDGIEIAATGVPPILPEREIVPLGEAVIEASGVEFHTGGTKAFYAPDRDFVAVPPQTAFFEQINYYRTALHELTHATGHAKRLGRNILNAFGSRDYAREELVAEMGSAFLCAALGIVPTVRHADYIGSWLEVLREDNRAIVRAASQASKAADWLLARLSQSPTSAHAPSELPSE